MIYEELRHGVIRAEARRQFQEIICELAEAGAEAAILGCTEIELLISQGDSDLPVYASTKLHARAAVDFAMQGHTALDDASVAV